MVTEIVYIVVRETCAFGKTRLSKCQYEKHKIKFYFVLMHEEDSMRELISDVPDLLQWIRVVAV